MLLPSTEAAGEGRSAIKVGRACLGVKEKRTLSICARKNKSEQIKYVALREILQQGILFLRVVLHGKNVAEQFFRCVRERAFAQIARWASPQGSHLMAGGALALK